MEYFLRFATSSIGIILLAIAFVAVVLARAYFHKAIVYRYPLVGSFAATGITSKHPYAKIIYVLRFIALLILVLVIARPQLVDPRSRVPVDGIDIMLVLDVSDSMRLPHHKDDERARIDVAKQEALHFINKRTNDAIGLVIFGNDSLSRCPLTADKRMLKEIIESTGIGSIDYRGTVLATGIITAANRLKHSQAKSKIMIVLTDGEPTEQDSDPRVAIKIAQQLGIKIYTIGIGSELASTMNGMFGMMAVPAVYNRKLLQSIATSTGGKFFEAKKPNDMRMIYDTINGLEKTKTEVPVFGVYYDLFMYGLWILFILLFLELFLSCWVWFSL